MTSFDWNDDKAIWEDLERAERMVGRRAEARKARKQKLSIPDDYDPERDCEIHDLRRQLDARIREAQTLHAAAELHAMIDISDGLAADVQHLCDESRCGAVLWADKIPISADARRMPGGRSPLEHALGDGEDFELVFAVSPADAQHLAATQPVAGVTLSAIGEVVTEGLWLEENGQRRALPPTGYVHQF